eukprot:TRINITY_DN67848_c5_g2_i1.p1 TRINITY_DN67848_c5_g2~~TRINITY_DN67848_c5_g2_i1.p1  ORF type:complete len:243 (+),score=10.20 TRINITY_DN67848_c5_g2_i1:38-730(+)
MQEKARLAFSFEEKQNKNRLFVILEGCVLESKRVGKEWTLLNCDDHQSVIAKQGKDYADYRPDVVHQCLLQMTDSPLHRAGLLQIYLHTRDGVLIEVSPFLRVPRSFQRFSKMMVELLKSNKIKAVQQKKMALLKVVKNPVTKWLPIGATIYACAKEGDTEDLPTFVQGLPEKPVVFVVGGFSRGHLDVDYAHKTVSVSPHPLSAAIVCAKLCNAFEDKLVPLPPGCPTG